MRWVLRSLMSHHTQHRPLMLASKITHCKNLSNRYLRTYLFQISIRTLLCRVCCFGLLHLGINPDLVILYRWPAQINYLGITIIIYKQCGQE